MSNLYTFDIEVAPTRPMSDFENGVKTLTDGDDTNVYSVATFDISKLEGSTRENKIGFVQHLSFDRFFKSFKQIQNGRGSFRLMVHNLSYEASFLIPWLLRNGFKQTLEKKLEKNQWKILESGSTVYRLMAMLGNVSFVFEDTFCKTGVSLEALFETVGYKAAVKGVEGKEFDYTKVRANGENPTDEENDYIYDDVAGLATVYEKLLTDSRITIGSEAYHSFVGDFYGHYDGRKTRKGEPIPYNWRLIDFKRFFPGRLVNKIFQPFYIGGYCDLIDSESSKRYDFPIYSYDRNSMYPAEMKGDMPRGVPTVKKWIAGEKPEDCLKTNKIVFFHIKFAIKAVKTVNYYAGKFSRTLYESHEDCLCYEALTIFKGCYDFRSFEIIETYTFDVYHGLFDKYVDFNYAIKKSTTGPARFKAKIRLNSLYGKMAQKPDRSDKIYSFKKDGILTYRIEDEAIDEDDIASYVPAALLIVQHARVCLFKLINAIRSAGYMVFYCDTDSIKTNASPEIVSKLGMKIDQKELGAWKMEGVGVKNVFVCPKKYMMLDKIGKQVACGLSGINKVSDKDTIVGTLNKKHINIDNYKLGLKITVNRRKVVRGGILLVPTIYTMNF